MEPRRSALSADESRTSPSSALPGEDAVAVSGVSVAPTPPGPPSGFSSSTFPVAGLVYVFEQDEEEPDGWDEVARLVGEPPAVGGQIDRFGISVDVESDTLVVAASRPHIPSVGEGGV